jgi:hypothetical protein
MLELDKDVLTRLTDKRLEKLVGRLAEAEVVACGGQISDVHFGGEINASDGGVDGRVNVTTTSTLQSGFIQRSNTIFQCKKPTMSRNKIINEMRPDGDLLPKIADQAGVNGGYVIVSLGDNCTDRMRNDRLDAMREAIGSATSTIHVDFIDRSKLDQWLRQHPSVMLWVRGVLGQPLSGWQAFSHWSFVPAEAPDDFIFGKGITVTLTNNSSEKLSLEEAIDSARKMILGSKKAIRIIGLSGVGKTRFVQALFEEKIGSNALDRTAVIYTDIGSEPNPSAFRMIEQLIIEERAATVVVDNCPPDMHSILANHVGQTENDLKLITVEYDIRDDKPEMTEVIQIEADGLEIASQLIQQRFPKIDATDANSVAWMAEGNARIALALADKVEDGEKVNQLSDETLFNRLFQQRHDDDPVLRQHAETLSLVYSFSVVREEDNSDELTVLGSLCSATFDGLYDSAQKLLRRGIAQSRGQWRAVLPQAIANRLATNALNRIHPSKFQEIFVAFDNNRLLMSFAHRLALLGNPPIPIVRDIISKWLSDGGILRPVLVFDKNKFKTLEYITLICPDLLLDQLEDEVAENSLADINDSRYSSPGEIVSLIFLLAGDPNCFERCIKFLIRVISAKSISKIEREILQLFKPCELSGTQASTKTKAEVVKRYIWSEEKQLQDLGIKMLSTTLDGPPWTRSHFAGAGVVRYGVDLNLDEFIEWRQVFINLAVEAGLDDDLNRSDAARNVLAKHFRDLWDEQTLENELFQSALKLNNSRQWIEGWKAVNELIYLDYTTKEGDKEDKPVPSDLMKLREILSPQDLTQTIKAYLLASNDWELDPEYDDSSEIRLQKSTERIFEKFVDLGKKFASSNIEFEKIEVELFSINCHPLSYGFGRGLAKGTQNLSTTWEGLVTALKRTDSTSYDFGVIIEFVKEVVQNDKDLSDRILDSCLHDPILRTQIVPLHPKKEFSEADFDRCVCALDYPETDPSMYEIFLRLSEFDHLPKEKVMHLVNILLEYPKGKETIVTAFSRKLNRTDKTVDTLGTEFRQIAMQASIRILEESDRRLDTMLGHHIERIIRMIWGHTENDDMKGMLLDTIFSGVDTHRFSSVETQILRAIVDVSPEAFLDRIFYGTEEQQRRREYIFERGTRNNKLLEAVDMGRIIQWCLKKDESHVWKIIAKALPVFISNNNDNTTSLSDASMQFLESSTYPKIILEGYYSQIKPTFFWAGQRSEIMESNTNAFRKLNEHKNIEIATIVKELCRKADLDIIKERENEQREDAEIEQRFE